MLSKGGSNKVAAGSITARGRVDRRQLQQPLMALLFQQETKLQYLSDDGPLVEPNYCPPRALEHPPAAQQQNPLVDDEDVLLHLMPFAEAEGYQFVGGVSKCWRDAWDGGGDGRPHETKLNSAVESASRLAWARSGGCRLDATTCERAAAGGHLDALRYARGQRCPWDAGTCTQAAASGKLSILRWAHANGCPWDVQTCATAAWGGNLDMIRLVL